MPKLQFSLQWLFLEITLFAANFACIYWLSRLGNCTNPGQILLPFFLFFSSGCGAIGGLFQWPVVGGLIGLCIAAALWPSLLHALS
jgi:hypothetical protein